MTCHNCSYRQAVQVSLGGWTVIIGRASITMFNIEYGSMGSGHSFTSELQQNY